MKNGLIVRQATARCDTCCHTGIQNHGNNSANPAICQHIDGAKVSYGIICSGWCCSISLASWSTHVYWWRFSSDWKVVNKSFGNLGAILTKSECAISSCGWWYWHLVHRWPWCLHWLQQHAVLYVLAYILHWAHSSLFLTYFEQNAQ